MTREHEDQTLRLATEQIWYDIYIILVPPNIGDTRSLLPLEPVGSDFNVLATSRRQTSVPPQRKKNWMMQ